MYEKCYVHKKFYVQEIAAVNLSKIYVLKIAKKTCKANNRDLIAIEKKLDIYSTKLAIFNWFLQGSLNNTSLIL